MTDHIVFADQLAVVTGGSRGIGLAVAKSLAQVGCRVIVLARSVILKRHGAADYPTRGECGLHAL